MNRLPAPALSVLAVLTVLTLLATGVAHASPEARDPREVQSAAKEERLRERVREHFPAALGELEQAFGVRIGLAAHNPATGESVWHRESEPFAFCSVFKLHLVAQVFKMADEAREDLLARRLHWSADEEQGWSPETGGRGEAGMSVLELCRASIRSSDNTAANVLLRLVGGPEALTEAARKLGDERFLLADREPLLNTPRLPEHAEPGTQPFNTTTPKSLLAFLERVLEGDVLSRESRERLVNMLGDVLTGDGRIRAALPDGYRLFHKTGTGERRVNDAGLIVNEKAGRLYLALFVEQGGTGASPAAGTAAGDTAAEEDALARLEGILAAAARLVLDVWFSTSGSRGLVLERTGFGAGQGARPEP